MFTLEKVPGSIQKRISNLEAEFARSEEPQIVDRLLLKISNDIKCNLPGDKAYLVDLLDESYIELLSLYKDYFYIRGYKDNKVKM